MKWTWAVETASAILWRAVVEEEGALDGKAVHLLLDRLFEAVGSA